MSTETFIFFAVYVSAVRCFQYLDCGSFTGEPLVVSVSDCNNEEVDFCSLKRGRYVTVNITFRTSENLYHVRSEGIGYINGFHHKFHTTNDICEREDMHCPLEPQKRHTYVERLKIPRFIPKARATVIWRLMSQGMYVVCALFPVATV